MNLINPNEDDAFEALGEMIEQAGSTRGSPLIGNAMNNDSAGRDEFEKIASRYKLSLEVFSGGDHAGEYVSQNTHHAFLGWKMNISLANEEIDQYRKDAERYKVLRDCGMYVPDKFSGEAPWAFGGRKWQARPAELDAAIDAAIEAGKARES